MYMGWSPLPVLSYTLCFWLFILKSSHITMLSHKHHYDRELGPDISWPVREIDCLYMIFIYSPPPWATHVCLCPHLPSSPASALCCFSIFSRRPRRESIFSLIWVSSRLIVWSWSVFTAHAEETQAPQNYIISRDKNLISSSNLCFIFIILIQAF